MSIGLVAFGKILLLTTPKAVELSVCIGVGGCLCPNSSSVFLIGTAFWELMNNAPSSASAAEVMTALIIVATLIMAPLLGGNGLSSDKK